MIVCFFSIQELGITSIISIIDTCNKNAEAAKPTASLTILQFICFLAKNNFNFFIFTLLIFIYHDNLQFIMQ